MGYRDGVNAEEGAVEEWVWEVGETRRVGMMGRGVQKEEGPGEGLGRRTTKEKGGGDLWGAVKEHGQYEGDKEMSVKVAREGVVGVTGGEAGGEDRHLLELPRPQPGLLAQKIQA